MRRIEFCDDRDPTVPLSPGIEHAGLVFVSGQVPFDLDTGEVVGDDIREQTAQTLDNVDAVLSEANCSLEDVVKTTVFLTDVANFDGMNDVYGKIFDEPYPARSAVEIGDLAADILVEIEAVAGTDQ